MIRNIYTILFVFKYGIIRILGINWNYIKIIIMT
jgi:hypothetical protein